MQGVPADQSSRARSRLVEDPRVLPRLATAMTDRFLVRAFATHLGWHGRFVEIGAAGSPWLGHVRRMLGAEAWGLDPSCRDLFDRSHLPARAFDVVYSGGYLDRLPSTRATLERFGELVACDGVVVTVVPNLRGLNGALQTLADRDIFARHVVHTPETLDAAHAAAGLVPVERTRYLDLVDLGCVDWTRVSTRLPRPLWRAVSYGLTLSRRAGIVVAARTDADGGRLFAPMIGGVYRRRQ